MIDGIGNNEGLRAEPRPPVDRRLSDTRHEFSSVSISAIADARQSTTRVSFRSGTHIADVRTNVAPRASAASRPLAR
jgi:hypothetical protein